MSGSGRRSTERYWLDVDLDLSRSVLVEPVLRNLHLRSVKVEHVEVHGPSDFRRLVVAEASAIGLSTFHGPVALAGSTFRSGFAFVAGREGSVRLDGGKCGLVVVSDCDFQGEFTRDGLETASGLVAASDFAVEPEPHPGFLQIAGELSVENLADAVRRKFGLDLPEPATPGPRG